jgi:co-chaperonin GroES (HSP10)
MKLQPIRDGIFVELEPGEEKQGTLYIADAYRKGKYAKVVAVGEGTPTSTGGMVRPCVNIGDRVMLLEPEKLGKEIEVEGKKLLVITESIIIGVER